MSLCIKFAICRKLKRIAVAIRVPNALLNVACKLILIAIVVRNSEFIYRHLPSFEGCELPKCIKLPKCIYNYTLIGLTFEVLKFFNGRFGGVRSYIVLSWK